MCSLDIETILLEVDSKILWELYEENYSKGPEGIKIFEQELVVNVVQEEWLEDSINKVKQKLSQVLWPKGFQGPIEVENSSENYDNFLTIGWVLQNGGGKTSTTSLSCFSFCYILAIVKQLCLTLYRQLHLHY